MPGVFIDLFQPICFSGQDLPSSMPTTHHHAAITVTRTTTTSTSAIILNTGYLKGYHGLLKLLQLLLGIVCVGIAAYYIHTYCPPRLTNEYPHPSYRVQRVDLYFLLVAVTCMITTFLLLLSCLISLATASILPKTVFEYLYHFVAFLLYLTAGIAYLVELVNRNESRYKECGFNEKIAAAAIGIILAALYLLSTIAGYRVYRIG